MTPARRLAARPFAARATWRLAVVMALAVTLLSLGGMGLQYRLVETRLMAAQERLLSADLDGFAALYDQRRIIALRQAIDYRVAAATGEEMLLLLDRNGTVLAGTVAGWPSDLVTEGAGFAVDPARVFSDGRQRWLAVARELPGGFPLLVARSLQPVDDTLAAMRRGMLGLLAALLVAGAGVGWLAARS
ncbi:MAG: hypothetical protein HC783_09855, partial [Rhodobacteraceae bacterium]|nr:hypothetical protein [Paracoccaceae bacterium]